MSLLFCTLSVCFLFPPVALLIYLNDPHSSHAEMRRRHGDHHRAMEEQLTPHSGQWPLTWDQTHPDDHRRQERAQKQRATFTQLSEAELNADIAQPSRKPPRQLQLRNE